MTHRGAAAAWAGVPDFLHNAPYAAVALQMALNHMKVKERVNMALHACCTTPLSSTSGESSRICSSAVQDATIDSTVGPRCI